MTRPTFDERDQVILDARVASLRIGNKIHVGDFVITATDEVKRVAYVWPDSIQLSDGGSFYLGDGYVSMSGSLDPGVPANLFVKTEETRPGQVWFFHHDWHQQEYGVYVHIDCPVWRIAKPRQPTMDERREGWRIDAENLTPEEMLAASDWVERHLDAAPVSYTINTTFPDGSVSKIEGLWEMDVVSVIEGTVKNIKFLTLTVIEEEA